MRQELVQSRRAEFREANTGDLALRMQRLQGPVSACPLGDVRLGRGVFVISVKGDIRERDNEEVKVSRSQRLADEADGVGSVLAAEGGMNAREVK